MHARHNQGGCDAVAQDIIAAGGQADTVLGDLSTAGVAEDVIQKTVDQFGQLDWVVANAGFPTLKSLDQGQRKAGNGGLNSFGFI